VIDPRAFWPAPGAVSSPSRSRAQAQHSGEVLPIGDARIQRVTDREAAWLDMCLRAADARAAVYVVRDRKSNVACEA